MEEEKGSRPTATNSAQEKGTILLFSVRRVCYVNFAQISLREFTFLHVEIQISDELNFKSINK